MIGTVALGILVPFIGTSLGAAMVFLLKKEINPKIQKLLLGFASGVMIAASIWSLILPSVELAKEAKTIEWLPAAVGFVAGMLVLLLLDSVIPHQHIDSEVPEGHKSTLGKSKLLFLSVTLHNVPEGMAVGAVFAGLLAAGQEISIAAAFSLSVGIALQNFPEGAIISMPLKAGGNGKGKAFLYGVFSGIVEPCRGVDHGTLFRCHYACASLSAFLCRGGHDLRGGGGAHSRIAERRSLEYRHDRRYAGVRHYDDHGYGAGLKGKRTF